MKFNMGIVIAGVGALVLLAAFIGKPKLTESERIQAQVLAAGGIPGLQ